MAFEGRNRDIQNLKEKIYNYDTPSASRFLNIYARSGMGKTTLIKKVISDLENSPDDLRGNYEFKYADTSDCSSFEQVLLRIRMEFKNSSDSFRDFDLLYTLFYDYSEYKKLIAQDSFYQELTAGKDSLKDRITHFLKNNIKSEKTIANSIAVIVEIALGCFSLATGQEIFNTIGGPILSAVNFDTLLKIIKSVFTTDSSSDDIKNIYDSARKMDEYKRDRLLAEYFTRGVNESDNLSKKIIVVDNYSNRTRVDNADHILGSNGIVTRGNAFWIFCSHNDLTVEMAEILDHEESLYELASLDKDAVSALVNSLSDSGRLSPDNKAELVNIFYERSNGLPMMLVIFLNVLEQQLKANINRTPGSDKFCYIDPQRFNGNYNNDNEKELKEQLRFYFEMGKTDLEKECFRILSCKEVWDENFYDIIREHIQLYLLNARNVLENDSLIEEITEGKIKLHDEVRESLYEHKSNIIKYDVMEIMYNYFLRQQDAHPIGDIDALQNFYTFTLELCSGLSTHHFKHMNTSPAAVYKRFYFAFYKTISYLDRHFLLSVNSTKLYHLYDQIVHSYEEITGKDKDYHKVLYRFGLYLYNAGRVQEASEIDRKYVEFMNANYADKDVPRLSDAFAYAEAYNAYAFDLSGLQRYAEADQYGQQSLNAALNALENTDDEPFYRAARHSIVQAISDLDNTDDTDTKNCLLPVIRDNFKQLEENSETYNLFFQLLKTRGNMPWYWINIPERAETCWQYAIHYGYNTWKLRELFYKENHQNTLTSMHNYAAYRIKCSSLALDEKLVIPQKTIEKMLLESLDTLSDLIQKYFSSTEFSKSISASYSDDKIFADAANMKALFKKTDIRSYYSDNCFKMNAKMETSEEITDFTLLYTNNRSTLESGQYMSFAYYCLAQNTLSSDQAKSIEYIETAIRIGNQILLGRIRLLGGKHKKTTETLNYTARYYILAARITKENGSRTDYIKQAQQRARLSLDQLYGIKPSEIMQHEYEAILEEAERLCNESNS